MPQLTLDIIQTPEMLFCHSTPGITYSLSDSMFDIVWHIYERDVMANEKQIEGNFVWWRKVYRRYESFHFEGF